MSYRRKTPEQKAEREAAKALVERLIGPPLTVWDYTTQAWMLRQALEIRAARAKRDKVKAAGRVEVFARTTARPTPPVSQPEPRKPARQ